LKKFIIISLLVGIFIPITSFTPSVLGIELRLIESGWNHHFKRRIHDHVHLVKFSTLSSKDTFLLDLIFTGDISKLKKGNCFKVETYQGGSFNYYKNEANVFMKKEEDLSKYSIMSVYSIKEFKTEPSIHN
jgi:hypothetical protein